MLSGPCNPILWALEEVQPQNRKNASHKKPKHSSLTMSISITIETMMMMTDYTGKVIKFIMRN